MGVWTCQHFKYMQFIIHTFYVNKVIKERKERKAERWKGEGEEGWEGGKGGREGGGREEGRTQ